MINCSLLSLKKEKLIFVAVFLIQIGMTPPLFAVSQKEAADNLLDPLKKLQDAFASSNKKTKALVKKVTSQKEQVDGLHLDGIASGSHGGGDVAILNGDDRRVGDEVHGYRILEIHSNFIQVENLKTGAKRLVWVNGTPSSQEMDSMKTIPNVTPDEMGVPVTFKDKIYAWSVQLGWVNQQATTDALLDLRRIRNAVDLMLREKSQAPNEMIDLIREHYLPGHLFQKNFFYIYSLTSQGVLADPKPAYTKLPHFFVGSDDVIRFSKNTAASDLSPVWDKAS